MDEKLILVIDIGGSKFVVGFMRMNGEILCQQRYVWQKAECTSVETEVVEKINDLYRQYPQYAERVVVTGMTLPGIANPKTGMWVGSGFMGADHYPIGPRLSEKLGIPVYVDNDCKACALAERYFGAGQDVDDFFYMTVSNGVGGAIFANGQLYYGSNGRCGEIGCCVIEEDGRMSDEGHVQGYLEMYACGRGLKRNFIEMGGAETYEGQPVDGVSIAKLAREGNPIALKTFELEGYYLGKALSWMCQLLNPKRIIIGGGLSMVLDLYLPSMTKTLEKLYWLGEDNDRVKIVATPLGYWGGLMGAGALGIRGLNGIPDSIPDID